MAVSRPIQALGPGFLSLLGMKNEGKLPSELVDQLSPVIDLTQFYLVGGRETISVVAPQVIAFNTAFVFPELIVPQREVWYVHGYTMELVTAAAGSATVAAQHYNRATIPIHTAPPLTLGGAGVQAMDQSLNDFLAPGGDLFGALVGPVVGAANTVDGNITITRLVS